jgi:hypothetical protein
VESELVQTVDNIDSLVSDQPNDLLSYIGQQQFQAAPSDLSVTQDESFAPQDAQQPVVEQNVVAPAPASAQAATPQPFVPGVTNPAQDAGSVEKQRYERAIADLTAQRDAERQTALRVAAEARRHEDQLFEASLKNMDPEQADLERARHEARRAKEAANFFRGQYEEKVATEQRANQESGKSIAAYKISQALGWSFEDAETLKTAETPEGMLALARTIYNMRQAQGQNQQQAPAQAPVQQQQQVNPALYAAGGAAPAAAPSQRTPQRQGDLIGMMRERPYQSVVVN